MQIRIEIIDSNDGTDIKERIDIKLKKGISAWALLMALKGFISTFGK